MGGRGSSSGMGRGSSGSSVRDQYDAADRDRLAAIARGDRGGVQSAIDKMDRAGNDILANEATNSMIEKTFDKYIDSAIRTEGVATTEKWVKSLASTNKDGSPRKTAIDKAKARSQSVAHEVSNALGIHISSYKISQSNLDKMVNPILKVARRRMSGGHLR